MSAWFPAQMLAGLPGMPGTPRNVLEKAKREHWQSRKRAGRGGGQEYALESLPAETRTALIQRQLTEGKALAKRPATQLDLVLPTVDALTDTQRRIAEARCAIVAEVLLLEQAVSREQAIAHVIASAQAGTLHPVLQQLANIANARGNADRVFSRRTVYDWMGRYQAATDPVSRLTALAPQARRAELQLPDWAATFLQCYRQPQKPSVSQAYRAFRKSWAGTLPSEHQVRRLLDKLPPEVRYRGRNTGAALKSLLPFVRRDWSKLRPNDVWVGDGHGMKMKVAHPDHGKPFKPEVTLILDAASRYVVGWSVSLSENVLAVSDALRFAVMLSGLPLIYYSDNGAGQTNKTLDAPITGTLARLGIQHELGLPGNPQGRGLIERAHQTILINLARRYDTFHGHGADRDTLRLTSRRIESALKRAAKSDEVVVLDQLPSWQQFLDDLAAAIEEYNSSHRHRELPKSGGQHMTPAEYRQRHLSGDDQVMLNELEARDLFRPHTVRVAQRGEVALWNNRYFSPELMRVDGEQVQVGYDIHDANQVIVRRMNGEFVCIAGFDANKRDGFALPHVQQLREQRVNRAVKRRQGQISDALAELGQTLPAIPAQDNMVLPGFGVISAEQIARAHERLEEVSEPLAESCKPEPAQLLELPVSTFSVPNERAARLQMWEELEGALLRGEELDERASIWHGTYQKTAEFRAFRQPLAMTA